MMLAADFGAVGDGQADDTKALQHAIEQSGGQLVLPHGSYRIDPKDFEDASAGRRRSTWCKTTSSAAAGAARPSSSRPAPAWRGTTW